MRVAYQISRGLIYIISLFFEISPNIIHSMDFIEDCIMVAMYDKCVEKSDGTKDIYTE